MKIIFANISLFLSILGIVILIILLIYWKIKDINKTIYLFDLHIRYFKLHSNYISKIYKGKLKMPDELLDDYFSDEELEDLLFKERDVRIIKSGLTRNLKKQK